MVCHEVDFLTFQESECLFSDLIKRCIICNVIIRKESKDLAGFLQILVSFDSAFIDTFFGGISGLADILSDIIDEAVDQVIMDFLIAMIDKAQKVDMHNPFIKLTQSEDRIVGH